MTQTLVKVRNLTKTFQTRDSTLTAVKQVDLDIYQGEIFSLLGPNGAGKTTLISMISGLLSVTKGTAHIGGYSITDEPLRAKALLGVVPQEIALYEGFSARQNLAFFGQMYGLGGAELNRRIDEVLAFIDLTERQHDRVQTFSGGQIGLLSPVGWAMFGFSNLLIYGRGFEAVITPLLGLYTAAGLLFAVAVWRFRYE